MSKKTKKKKTAKKKTAKKKETMKEEKTTNIPGFFGGSQEKIEKVRTKKDPWYMQYMNLCDILNAELKPLGFEIDHGVWHNPRATILTEAPDMWCSICGRQFKIREIVLATTLHWNITMGLRYWLVFKNPDAFDYMTSGTLHPGAVLCLDRTPCHDRTVKLHEQFSKNRGSLSQKEIIKAVKLFDGM